MDVVFLELAVHIVEIHAPYALIVAFQGAVHDAETVVLNTVRKTDICRTMKEHGITRSGKSGKSGDKASDDAVFVADMFSGQPSDAIALALPVDNGVKILIGGCEISKSRMLSAIDYCLSHRGNRREIHIGYPHGDKAETIFWGSGRHIRHSSQCIHCQSILAMAIHDGCEIVLHGSPLPVGVRFSGAGIGHASMVWQPGTKRSAMREQRILMES